MAWSTKCSEDDWDLPNRFENLAGVEGEGAASVSTGSLVVNILNLPNRFVNIPGVVTLSEVDIDAVDAEVGDGEDGDVVLMVLVVLVAVTVVVTASVAIVGDLSGILVALVLAVVKIFPRPLNILEPLLLVLVVLVVSEDLEASAVSVDDKLCGPNAVPVGVAVATVVDDLLVDLVEDVVILTAFSMPGSRVELGIVWVTGWSTVVVANTPLLKLSRPRCLQNC